MASLLAVSDSPLRIVLLSALDSQSSATAHQTSVPSASVPSGTQITEPPSPSNHLAHPLSTPLKNVVDLSDYRIEYVPATATARSASSVNIVIRSAPLPANYRKLHHTSEQSTTLTHSILLDVRSVEKQLKNCSKAVLSRSPTLEQFFAQRAVVATESTVATIPAAAEAEASSKDSQSVPENSNLSTETLTPPALPFASTMQHIRAAFTVISPSFAAPVVPTLDTLVIIAPRFVDVDALLAAFDFLHSGKVYVERRHFFELLSAAHWLQLKKLEELCVSRISAALSPKTVMQTAHYAARYNFPSLLQDCYRCIIKQLLPQVELACSRFQSNQHLSTSSGVSEPDASGPALSQTKQYLTALTQGPFSVPLNSFVPFISQQQQSTIESRRPVDSRYFAHVRVDRSTSPSHTYRMYSNDKPDEVLLSARCVDDEYVICVHTPISELITKESPNFAGSVRSNLAGTEFIIYDAGMDCQVDERLFPLHRRKQLGLIKYDPNFFGTAPRSFEIIVPKLFVSSSELHGVDFAIDEAYHAQDRSKILILRNKPPVWSPELDAYTLDFQSYVKLPSKKNFQLIADTDLDTLYFMFGKTERDTYHLDCSSPLSPLQAFAIALSSLDHKKLVT